MYILLIQDSGMKLYNQLPSNIKQFSNNNSKFKMALKRFLLTKSFYTLEEYFNWNNALGS